MNECALRESVREQKETASTGRNQTLALQRKLEQEKSQGMADISRTTQTHASLIVEANDRIKRLEVCAPPSWQNISLMTCNTTGRIPATYRIPRGRHSIAVGVTIIL